MWLQIWFGWRFYNNISSFVCKHEVVDTQEASANPLWLIWDSQTKAMAWDCNAHGKCPYLHLTLIDIFQTLFWQTDTLHRSSIHGHCTLCETFFFKSLMLTVDWALCTSVLLTVSPLLNNDGQKPLDCLPSEVVLHVSPAAAGSEKNTSLLRRPHYFPKPIVIFHILCLW